jgi:hypothetical protein
MPDKQRHSNDPISSGQPEALNTTSTRLGVCTAVPLSKETYGRLGKPAMRLLGKLGDLAADGGNTSKAGFVSCWLREVSVQMARGNGMLFRVVGQGLARVGRNMPSGLLRPGSDLD